MNIVQPLNYPTNMLFAAAMAATGRMYNLPQMVDQAERLRKVIRQQSYDGQFFVDNAVLQGREIRSHAQPHRNVPVLRVLFRCRDAGNLS